MFEDDELLRQMYKTTLDRDGFDVRSYVYPPDNIVDIIADGKPDLISMGVIMPHMTGFDATKLLKADERTKNIPLVFLTNLGQQDDIDKGMSLGAAKYIIKAHHTPSEVINIFRKILGLPELPILKPIINPVEPASHMTPYTDFPSDEEINKREQK